jgi:DNA-binding GntR family transcriptional regulator
MYIKPTLFQKVVVTTMEEQIISDLPNLVFADASVGLLHLTKTEVVSTILREAIITGRLKPGDHIRQQELAELLNVSPTPVREALYKLVALGILEYEAHHGAQVPIPSKHAIDEIFQVRVMLEGMAIKETVKYIDDTTLAKLEDLALSELPMLLEESLATKNLIPYRVANYQFHKKIYTASEMEVIPTLIDTLWARSVVQAGVFFFDECRISNANAEHARILEALQAKEGERASEVLRQHVDATRTCYLNYLDQVEQE